MARDAANTGEVLTTSAATVDALKTVDKLRGFVANAIDEIQDRDRTIARLKEATPSKYIEQQQALDTVAKLIHEMGHTGILGDIYKWDQTKRQLRALENNPSYQEAEKRRQQKFWDHLEQASREVDSWPEWKKGISVSGR